MKYSTVTLEFKEPLTLEQEKILIRYFGRVKLTIQYELERLAKGYKHEEFRKLMAALTGMAGTIDPNTMVQQRAQSILALMKTHDESHSPINIIAFGQDDINNKKWMFMLSDEHFSLVKPGSMGIPMADSIISKLGNGSISPINGGFVLAIHKYLLPELGLGKDDCAVEKGKLEIAE